MGLLIYCTVLVLDYLHNIHRSTWASLLRQYDTTLFHWQVFDKKVQYYLCISDQACIYLYSMDFFVYGISNTLHAYKAWHNKNQ